MHIVIRDILDKVKDNRDSVKSLLEMIHIPGFNSLTVAFLDGRRIRMESTVENRHFVHVNAAPPEIKNDLDISEIQVIDYIGIANIMQGAHQNYVPYTEDGIDLMYMDKHHLDYYIPFNPFELGEVEGLALLKKVIERGMKHFKEIREQRFYWSDDTKTDLLKQLNTQINDISTSELRQAEDRLRYAQDNERTYRERLRNAIRDITQNMERIQDLKSRSSNVEEKVSKEFDLIMKNPDVKAIKIQDGYIEVQTNPIVCIADTGKRYDVGSFTIRYNLTSTGIEYFGDTPRGSYWGPSDPHPHVNGNNGEPCLGNVGEAVAQLSSSHEYAALVTVAIEFLKAANTGDPAGRNVKHWDEIDADGNVIKEGYQHDPQVCDVCEEDIEEGEAVTVYYCADADDVWDERTVCESCQAEHYPFSEHHNTYIYEDCPDEAFDGPSEPEPEEEDEEEMEEAL